MTRAGGVDWVERWRQMQQAAQRAPEQDCGEDRWRHRAERFDRVSRQRADAAVDLIGGYVSSTDTVADVGAGTGRHVVPLSRRCARAVAIEPSPSMRARLEARLSEESVTNVTVLAEAWPCAAPEADVTYSCHVLYGVEDAPRFLQEMTRATRRTCLLVLGLRAPADRLGALWSALHGHERPPRPAALEALALLYQLGHEASLRIIPGSGLPMAFLDKDEDIDELCHRLHEPADEAGRGRVRRALEQLYPRRDDQPAWDLGVGEPNALIEWSVRGEHTASPGALDSRAQAPGPA